MPLQRSEQGRLATDGERPRPGTSRPAAEAERHRRRGDASDDRDGEEGTPRAQSAQAPHRGRRGRDATARAGTSATAQPTAPRTDSATARAGPAPRAEGTRHEMPPHPSGTRRPAPSILPEKKGPARWRSAHQRTSAHHRAKGAGRRDERDSGTSHPRPAPPRRGRERRSRPAPERPGPRRPPPRPQALALTFRGTEVIADGRPEGA